jgi:hypothetical protein
MDDLFDWVRKVTGMFRGVRFFVFLSMSEVVTKGLIGVAFFGGRGGMVIAAPMDVPWCIHRCGNNPGREISL